MTLNDIYILLTVSAKLADNASCLFEHEMCERILKSKFWSNLYIGGTVVQLYVDLLAHLTFFADQFQIVIEFWIGEDSFDKHDRLFRFLSIMACFVLALPFLIPKKINMLQIPGILICISSTSIVILAVFIYADSRNSDRVCET